MTESEYPPLTAVAEYPLHGWDYGDSYACQRPEDPDCLTYDWRCPACILAAQAHIEHHGDLTVKWRLNAHDGEQDVKLSWLIDRALFWLYDRFDWPGPVQSGGQQGLGTVPSDSAPADHQSQGTPAAFGDEGGEQH